MEKDPPRIREPEVHGPTAVPGCLGVRVMPSSRTLLGETRFLHFRVYSGLVLLIPKMWQNSPGCNYGVPNYESHFFNKYFLLASILVICAAIGIWPRCPDWVTYRHAAVQDTTLQPLPRQAESVASPLIPHSSITCPSALFSSSVQLKVY